MQTHRNADHMKELAEELGDSDPIEQRRAWRELETEAERMKAAGESSITAGEEDETPLREWKKYGVHVRQFPERDIDAPLDIVRVSTGGVAGSMAYLVFRGPTKEVKDILRRALNALRDEP